MRGRRSLLLVVGACAFALLVASPAMHPSYSVRDVPSVTASTAWLVTGNERAAPGSVTVASAIVVLAGATLVVEDASLLLASDLPCANVGGRSCVPGVTVEPGGRLVLRNASVAGRDAGAHRHPTLHVLGAVEATGSTFDRVAGFVLTGDEAHGAFEGNAFRRSSGAITIHRGASGLVRGNLVEGIGLYVADASVRLEGNTVRDAILGIQVSSTIVGSRCCRGVPSVEGNVVEGGVVGIFVDSMEGFEVRGNVVRGAEFGVNVTVIPEPDSPRAGSPAIVGNRFEGVHTGVTFRSAASHAPTVEATPATLLVRGNDFSGACVGVLVDPSQGPLPIRADARANWWGSPAGPSHAGPCVGAVGDVLTSPWLTGAP